MLIDLPKPDSTIYLIKKYTKSYSTILIRMKLINYFTPFLTVFNEASIKNAIIKLKKKKQLRQL